MTTPLVVSGYNATVAYGTTSTPTTLIANLKSVKIPAPKADTLDITPINATGRYKTFTLGMIDGDKIECTCYYENADYALHYALLGTTQWFLVTAPDAGSMLSQAIVEECSGIDFAADAVPTYKLVGKVTGVVTFTV
jgi:predicted secreted protein